LEKPECLFRDDSYALIANMLEIEREPLVLDSAISALGHLEDARAVPLILRYEDHPDRSVRFAVAFALGHFANDPQSIPALLRLTSDVDTDVRDWAVFGPGVQGDADSPRIREALLRSLDDRDQEVREEAARGLAKRGGPRMLPALQTMLKEPGLKIWVAESAAALLGLEPEPTDWTAADYQAALLEKFPAA
jgi:HEAT repeat protein